MLTIENVKDFVFDVLGDFVDPKDDVEVEQLRNGKFRVIVLRSYGMPSSMLRDEWNRAASGTDFETIQLFLPVE